MIMNNPDNQSEIYAPGDDVNKAINDLLSADRHNMPKPKLSREFRMLCVVELQTKGIRVERIGAIMGIHRSTVFEDLRRWRDFTATVDMSEHVNTTAATINRKFDLLWEKALADGELNVARMVERDRVLLLQSMGIIHKLADKAEIKVESADVRPRKEVIDVIARRIEKLGLGHKKGDGPEVQE